jgi:hypothetical protein
MFGRAADRSSAYLATRRGHRCAQADHGSGRGAHGRAGGGPDSARGRGGGG